jgi:hypothetical protein
MLRRPWDLSPVPGTSAFVSAGPRGDPQGPAQVAAWSVCMITPAAPVARSSVGTLSNSSRTQGS